MDFIQKGLIGMLVATLVVLLSIYLQTGRKIGIGRGSRSPYYKRSFLILGNNGAGKTGLFYRLKDESQEKKGIATTVSSIEPNITEVTLPFSSTSVSIKYQLIDYPGHLKYFQLLNKLMFEDITLANIKGICYVIDSASSSFNANIEVISKFLFNVFSITERTPNGVDFLFSVNKSDLFESISAQRIRTLLEAEINKLVQNELNNVDKNSGIDKEDSEVDGGFVASETLREFWLGVVSASKDRKFRFEQLEGGMDFVSGSVLRNNIDGWKNWIDEKVVN